MKVHKDPLWFILKPAKKENIHLPAFASQTSSPQQLGSKNLP